MKVGIIGAGVAGLASASALAAGGASVEVLEKSRGIGGRLATRRARAGHVFAHGAPVVHGRSLAFREYLEHAAAEGAAVRWPSADNAAPAYVGAGVMSDLVRPLAKYVDVRLEAEASRIANNAGCWCVLDAAGGELGAYDAVIVSAPAPQAVSLTADIVTAANAFASVSYSPGWTLLAAFNEAVAQPQADAMIASAYRMSDRPGDDTSTDRWVVHASLDWTNKNLELDKPEAAVQMLDHLSAQAWSGAEPIYAAAHRWRYARTDGGDQRTLTLAPGLIAAGELFGGDANGSYQSGLAAAQSLLND